MKHALLVLTVLFPLTAAAQFEARVHFSPIANLTYQLDCVAGAPIPCSTANLEELWKREFLRSDQDRELLAEWKRLRARYAQNVVLDRGSGESLGLFDKLRIAGFQSKNADEWAARLDLLTTPADRRAFERVLRQFEPRFAAWWQKEALAAGTSFAAKTETLLRSPAIADAVRQFHHFFGPDLPSPYELSFNLLYVPELVREATSGQQLQNYSLVEFKPTEKPAQRIDVAIHELCHFFFDSMPPERRTALQQRFTAMNRAGATPAFNLLNEALAAAFGNGMIARQVTPPAEFARYVATPGSFYANGAVDRAAKALLPWLDEWLAKGRTIHDPEFAGRYLSVLESAFGDDLLRPKLYLSEMLLFVDRAYGTSMRREVRRVLEVASLYASEGALSDEQSLATWRAEPRMNAVLIVHPENVPQLVQQKVVTEAQAKEIADELQARQRALYAFERGPFTHAYIVSASDANGVSALIGILASAKPFRGLHPF